MSYIEYILAVIACAVCWRCGVARGESYWKGIADAWQSTAEKWKEVARLQEETLEFRDKNDRFAAAWRSTDSKESLRAEWEKIYGRPTSPPSPPKKRFCCCPATRCEEPND